MKQLLKSPLFHFGLLARLVCLGFFGSTYLKDLFIPFLDEAVLHPGSNPWSLSPPHYFPYGSALFLILYIPRLIAFKIVGAGALGTGFLGMALVKAPLLILELLLFRTLVRFTPLRVKTLILYFWLNPILFFITYIHGQLDIAAMGFILYACLLLTEKKPFTAGVVTALSALCKFHVVIAIPFFLVFLWQGDFLKKALRDMASFLLGFAPLVVAGFLPLFFAKHIGYVTTTSPEAYRIFATRIPLGEEQYFYVGIALLLGVLTRLCISTRISEEGLFMGTGFLFGVLLLITRSMPGWYYWVVPFLVVFFANYLMAPRMLFWALNIFYLIYFGVIGELNLVVSPLISDTLFTLLQTSLLGTLIGMWILILRSETPLSGRVRPFFIGIAGDSGTGKNRLSGVLGDLLDPDRTLVLEGDDYHKWERHNKKWVDYTHLHPKANMLEQLAEHTNALLSGKLVFHPHYDHSTGSFTGPRLLKPNRHLILQGLHAFYRIGMRGTMALRVYLAPDPQLRLAWKIRRDVSERGHDVDTVIQQLRRRGTDAKRHILPQKKQADWIIEAIPEVELSNEQILKGIIPKINMRHIVWNDTPVAELARLLDQDCGCRAEVENIEEDVDRIALLVRDEPSVTSIAFIAKKLFPNLKQITRGLKAPRWRAGHEGVEQLLALLLFNQRLKEQT